MKGAFGCSYVPDIQYLNKVIEQWMQEDILFRGIIHTHFHNVKTLSEGDKEYIFKILQAMPPEMPILSFPIIVLPQRELVNYQATLFDGRLKIERDSVEVV